MRSIVAARVRGESEPLFFDLLSFFVILSEAKDLLSRAPAKSRSFASLRMTIHLRGVELFCVCDPVNRSPSIIAHVHRPVPAERNPYRTPHPAAFLRSARREPSGNEVFRAALGLSFIVEFHAHDFVSGRNASIPRTMKCDEDVVPVLRRELRGFIKRESQRGGMRLHLDLRSNYILATIVARL